MYARLFRRTRHQLFESSRRIATDHGPGTPDWAIPANADELVAFALDFAGGLRQFWGKDSLRGGECRPPSSAGRRFGRAVGYAVVKAKDPVLRMPGLCWECPVKERTLYSHADDRFQGIERLSKDVRRVSAKRVILREGDKLHQFYTLFDGWAFRFRLLHDGRRQILSFLLPGSAIGLPLHGSAVAGSSVQALTDVALCVFDRAELAGYLQSAGEDAAALERIYDRLCAAADERLVDLGRRSALERLARFIMEIRRLAGCRADATGDTMYFPLKRQHIADALGLTPVHVGRVLGRLMAEKIIRIDGASLTVLDAAALAELSK